MGFSLKKDCANPGFQHKNQFGPKTTPKIKKMKKIILVTLAFIAVSHGQNSNEIKYSPNWFNSISVTPTNIVFVFHHTNSVIITQENESRRSLSNELFYLTPDREIILTVGKHTQYKYSRLK